MDSDSLGLILAFIIGIVIAVLIVRIPIVIAKKRGITGSDLTIIAILSWLGILIGVTWIVALVFSLIWIPKKNGGPAEIKPLLSQGTSLSNVEALEKLGNLKEKGLITEEEFNREKTKLLDTL